MNKRIDTLCFPGGKHKALTLSYDDGVIQDRRLVQILNRYGLKCTFNIGSGVLGYQGSAVFSEKEVDVSKVSATEVKDLYADHEVAGHGLYHSSLTDVGTPTAMYEIIEDRRQLEKIIEKPVYSFAYPFGTYNNTVKQILHLAGYRSARTVVSSHSFDLPEDFLEWNATCHHNDPQLMTLAKQFCQDSHRFLMPQLFYLWGHAYEFDGDDNWDVIETFADYVAQYADDIWFATNGQIVRYVNAFRSLEYTTDASLIHNPTATDLWICINGNTLAIPAGKTVSVTQP